MLTTVPFVDASFCLGNRKNRETFEQSKACFLRAIELDPNYAQAIAGSRFCVHVRLSEPVER